jgi:DNA ligase-4
LVLKPNDPYFDFSMSRRPYSCCCIKLKKEYVGSFGDVGDFAVVGARYDATKAKSYGIPNLKWTHFFVGCLENKEEVQRWKRTPRFVATNVVELSAAQLKLFITNINPKTVPEEENRVLELRVEPGIDNGKRPQVIFPQPPIVDLRCFSFEKLGNTGFWSLRFPTLNKFQFERTYHDAIGFTELQEMAESEKLTTPPEDSEELMGWIAALEQADPGGIPVDAVTQCSDAAGSTITSSPANRQNSPQTSPASQVRASQEATASQATASQVIPDIPSNARYQQVKIHMPAHIELTPPKSSALTAKDREFAMQSPERSLTRNQRSKRQLEPSKTPRPAKIPARGERPFRPSPASLQSCKSSSPWKERGALTDITTSFSQSDNATASQPSRSPGGNSFYLPFSGNDLQGNCGAEPMQSSVAGSFRTAPGSSPPSSPPILLRAAFLSEPREDKLPLPIGPYNITPHQCRYCPESCPLAGYSFLLAPCISMSPWITEDLLSSHGVTSFHTDPREWKDKSETDVYSSSMPPGLADNTDNLTTKASNRGVRKRKIVLVESRRERATRAFLDRIESAQLQRRGGKREWVRVFDWRVIEDLTKEEAKCSRAGENRDAQLDMRSAQSIWRQYWVGLA